MNEEEIASSVQNRERHKIVDAYKDYIESLLQKYPKLTAGKIKKKLKAKGVGEAISERTFRRYVKQIKSSIPVKQVR
jgi:hypothetical protein